MRSTESKSNEFENKVHGTGGYNATELQNERIRRALEEKFNSRPRVRRHRTCVRELRSNEDFLATSDIGIEFAARHVAEYLGRPDAVLSRAYWSGNTPWIEFWERKRGPEVEGLFEGLPAYADGPIITEEFHMGHVDFEPPGGRDEMLTALGYPPAWAYEVEELLAKYGKDPREAMQDGLARAIEWAVEEIADLPPSSDCAV